jgi:hypothetical protein
VYQSLPFPSDCRPGIARGRGGLILIRVFFSSRYSRYSSVNVMVEQMLMVLLGIMVSQLMLLVGGVADAGKRLVESKLLEWFRSNAASWRG